MKRIHSLPLRTLVLSLAATAVSGAATLVNEGFEGGTNVFNMPTYAYTANYTQANTLTPASGLRYAHGGNPAAGTNIVYTQNFSGPTLLLTSFGFNATDIDSGLVAFDFTGQFSTYQSQNDYAVVSILFRDGTGTPIGSAVSIGSQALVSALAGGTGNRAWGSDSQTGFVPSGARDIVMSVAETKNAEAVYIDGYVDNIRLDVNVVPEPGSVMLGLLGSVMLLRRRK